MYKLEKDIKLYKNQFDSFMLNLYHDHRMERCSIELDGIMFRIRYMIKHNKDLDKLDELKEEFVRKALALRNTFGEFLYEFLISIVMIPVPFHLEDIEDVLAQDVAIDGNYIQFKMILISKNKTYLEWVDNMVPENTVYNMFPHKLFRFSTDSYNDGIAKAFPELFKQRKQTVVGTGDDEDVFCHNFTFQLLEGCSLSCTYCYQNHKCNTLMSMETAELFIDHLLNDDYGYINRYNSPAIIVEFIGGEPLLAIKRIREIYEYFLDRCYKMNHPWFMLHRISLCSNGLQYFDLDVQSFFKEYSSQISFNISIDGNKELHDACRIQPNGEGSYDIAMSALNHYNKYYTKERNSKMTLAPQNISYLYDSVVNFIQNDMTVININCIFEEGWNRKTANEEYHQLIRLADYIIENDLHQIYIAIFNERQEWKLPPDNDASFCGGGAGSMLAMRPNGDFYPCIRYMPSSVGVDVPDSNIGNVKTGMIGRKEKSYVLSQLDRNTRRMQMTDICYECPIGNSCASCAALGYQIYGSYIKRTTFHCIQTIAEHLANVYYWNALIIKHPEFDIPVRKLVVPDVWALNVISEEELEYLKMLETYAVIRKMEA